MKYIIVLLILLYLFGKFIESNPPKTNNTKQVHKEREVNRSNKVNNAELYKSYADFYKAKDGIWDNYIEKRGYDNIVRFLSNGADEILFKWYRLEAIPHLSLREIFVSKSKKYEARNLKKLATYHVDIAFVDKFSGKTIFAIEIDGENHNSEEQMLRDIFKDNVFKLNDIPLIRIENKKIDDKEYILKKIKENTDNLTPLCPLCNGKMIVKRNSKNGKNFWGCSSYPNCKGSI